MQTESQPQPQQPRYTYIVYEIRCKDASLTTEKYIGCTRHYAERQKQHKWSTRCSDLLLYQYLREINHGIEERDFDVHWEMVRIAELFNATFAEARQLERYFVSMNKNTLNTWSPYSTDEEKRAKKKLSDVTKYQRKRDMYLAKQKAYQRTRREAKREAKRVAAAAAAMAVATEEG